MSNMGKSETSIQIQFIGRVRFLRPEYALLVFAIPNGGKRDLKTAMILKSMGVTAGVPDVCCAIARRGYHGLFLEFKKPGGRTTVEQERVIVKLIDEGYMVKVCDSVEEAFRIFEDYVDGKNSK